MVINKLIKYYYNNNIIMYICMYKYIIYNNSLHLLIDHTRLLRLYKRISLFLNILPRFLHILYTLTRIYIYIKLILILNFTQILISLIFQFSLLTIEKFRSPYILSRIFIRLQRASIYVNIIAIIHTNLQGIFNHIIITIIFILLLCQPFHTHHRLTLSHHIHLLKFTINLLVHQIKYFLVNFTLLLLVPYVSKGLVSMFVL